MEFTENVGHRVSVSGILKKLGVSYSGFRSWKDRAPSASELRRNRVKEEILDIHNRSHQNCGAPKITVELRRSGEKISERTVGEYMRQLNVKAQWVKPFTHTTIAPDFSVKLKNILDEQFDPEYPNAAWCSDITYIAADRGFVCLTSIMDLFSRKIIARTLSETLEAEYVAVTVRKAMRERHITAPLVMHTDRGSQYVSAAYLKAAKGLILSYSKKGYPYDNACIESFHSLIKREWLNRFKIRDFDHAKKLVFEYIEAFYNTIRIHSHCDFYSPNDFEIMHNSSFSSDRVFVS